MQEIQGILDNLKNPDWWARKKALDSLVTFPGETYLETLEQWLRNDEDALIRNSAKETYRALGKKALKALVPLLKDKDADVRIFSANVLGDIKEREALQSLVEALDDPEDNVRAASAEALGKIGDAGAIHALAEALDDETWVAMAALEAISLIGGEDALAVLYECLKNEEYRGMACAAIEKAGDRGSIEHLAPLLDMEDANEQALQAIVSLAEREKIELSPSLFSGHIGQLTDWMSSPQDEVRRAAFIALSWSEDIRGLPYLLKACQDELLLEYALNGLLSLGNKAAPEIIKAMEVPLKNKGMLAKVLSMMGEKEALMLFAEDEDDEVRTEVALAVGSLRTPQAALMLQTLSSDPAEEVRAAALLSLRNSERYMQDP